jgi:hypothetical protein
MFSTPPVSETFAAPIAMSWAPLMIDWNPEPQRRLIPSAGFSIGIPTFKET